MPITTITTPPSRTAGLSQDAFSAAMESTLNTMKQAVDDINANASQYNVATTGTSTSSVLIGTGAKTFTTQSGLGFVVGMTLRIANSSANFMTGEVTSYSGTSLVMNITSVGGSGTLASWTISMAAVGASTAATVSNTPAGSIASTTVQAAINELDSEKLSSAAGAVTDTNLSTIATAGTYGNAFNIPTPTITAKGRVTAIATAPKITSATPIATTSGTAHDFTSIPAGAKKITVMLSGVSTSGTSQLLLQLGDSGGIEATGYSGSVMNTTSQFIHNTGFEISGTTTAASIWHGSIVLTLMDSATNTWAAAINIASGGSGFLACGGGIKSLSAVLDRLRLTTTNGTDTFDAGSINIVYE